MGDHHGAREILGKLVHHLGKLARILDLLRPDAVDCDVERRKPHGLRPDQTFLDPYHFAVLDPRKADRTGAATLFARCFEIDGDGFQGIRTLRIRWRCPVIGLPPWRSKYDISPQHGAASAIRHPDSPASLAFFVPPPIHFGVCRIGTRQTYPQSAGAAHWPAQHIQFERPFP